MKPTIRVSRSKLFGRFEFYLLDMEHNKYWKSKEKLEGYPPGSVHFFLNGPVFLIRIEETHHVWTPSINEAWPISKIGIETKIVFGIFKRMKIRFGDKTKTYYQMNWSGLNEAIDPFWDNIDKDSNDFMYHLENAKRRQLKKDSESET